MKYLGMVGVVLSLLTGYVLLSGGLQHISHVRVLNILEEQKTPDEGTALQDGPKAPLSYSF